MINDADNRWSDENTKHLQQKKIRNIENKLENVKNSGQISEDSIQEHVNGNKLNIKSSDNMKKSERLEKEEPSITKSDIKSVIRLLQEIASGVIELQGIKPYEYNEKGRDTTRRGRAHIYRYLNYYDIINTIKKAGHTDPQDFDSPIYNVERIYDILERYSDIINVANDGTEPLFVTISHEGKTNFSKESVILPGEVKQYYNVYELRLRSPQIGLPYRVTEYLLMSVSQTSLTPSELVSLQDEPLPEKDTDWLSEDITPLIFPTTFRIQVAVSIEGIFSVAITNDGNTQVVDFNATSGPELIKDGVYVFELLVHKGDSINFRYSEDGGTIKILRLQEIDAATT